MTHLSYRRAASVNRLMEIKDVTEEDALEIRDIWKTFNRGDARYRIDKVLNTCGVEYIGVSLSGHDVYHCNGGDPYATTVIFAHNTLTVGCTADLRLQEGS